MKIILLFVLIFQILFGMLIIFHISSHDKAQYKLAR